MEKIQSEWRMLKKVPAWVNLYMYIYTIFKWDANELKVISVIEDINSVVYDVMEKDFDAKKIEKMDIDQIEFIRDIADFYEIKKNHIILSDHMYDYKTEKYIDEKGENQLWLRVLHIRETLLRINKLPKLENCVANVYINKNKPKISVVVINSVTQKAEYEIFLYKQPNELWLWIIWELSYVDMENNINDKFWEFKINDVNKLEVAIYEVLKKLSLKTTVMFTYWDWELADNSWETQIHRFFLDKKLWL